MKRSRRVSKKRSSKFKYKFGQDDFEIRPVNKVLHEINPNAKTTSKVKSLGLRPVYSKRIPDKILNVIKITPKDNFWRGTHRNDTAKFKPDFHHIVWYGSLETALQYACRTDFGGVDEYPNLKVPSIANCKGPQYGRVIFKVNPRKDLYLVRLDSQRNIDLIKEAIKDVVSRADYYRLITLLDTHFNPFKRNSVRDEDAEAMILLNKSLSHIFPKRISGYVSSVLQPDPLLGGFHSEIAIFDNARDMKLSHSYNSLQVSLFKQLVNIISQGQYINLESITDPNVKFLIREYLQGTEIFDFPNKGVVVNAPCENNFLETFKGDICFYRENNEITKMAVCNGTQIYLLKDFSKFFEKIQKIDQNPKRIQNSIGEIVTLPICMSEVFRNGTGTGWDFVCLWGDKPSYLPTDNPNVLDRKEFDWAYTVNETNLLYGGHYFSSMSLTSSLFGNALIRRMITRRAYEKISSCINPDLMQFAMMGMSNKNFKKWAKDKSLYLYNKIKSNKLDHQDKYALFAIIGNLCIIGHTIDHSRMYHHGSSRNSSEVQFLQEIISLLWKGIVDDLTVSNKVDKLVKDCKKILDLSGGDNDNIDCSKFRRYSLNDGFLNFILDNQKHTDMHDVVKMLEESFITDETNHIIRQNLEEIDMNEILTKGGWGTMYGPVQILEGGKDPSTVQSQIQATRKIITPPYNNKMPIDLDRFIHNINHIHNQLGSQPYKLVNDRYGENFAGPCQQYGAKPIFRFNHNGCNHFRQMINGILILKLLKPLIAFITTDPINQMILKTILITGSYCYSITRVDETDGNPLSSVSAMCKILPEVTFKT